MVNNNLPLHKTEDFTHNRPIFFYFSLSHLGKSAKIIKLFHSARHFPFSFPLKIYPHELTKNKGTFSSVPEFSLKIILKENCIRVTNIFYNNCWRI